MKESVAFLIVGSAFATYIWRALGVALGDRISPDSALFEWLSCVAYALLAGLMARIIIFPAGVLEDTPLVARLIAMALGFVVFFWLRKNFLAATLVSTVTLYLLISRVY